MPAFLVDEDVPRSTAPALRQAGYLAEDVRDVGLRGHPDQDIFAYAQAHGQILVTADKRLRQRRELPSGQPPRIGSTPCSQRTIDQPGQPRAYARSVRPYRRRTVRAAGQRRSRTDPSPSPGSEPDLTTEATTALLRQCDFAIVNVRLVEKWVLLPIDHCSCSRTSWANSGAERAMLRRTCTTVSGGCFSGAA